MSEHPTRPESVQEAIRQTRPFRSVREEAVVALLLTTEYLRRPMQALFAEHGDLTQQQYNVLRILRGSRETGLPTLEIAERMVERTPGVTRLIDRLEAKNLVRRERSAKDRRQVYCFLTTAGEELLASLDAPVATLNESLLAGLEDAEVRALIGLLDRVRAAASACAAQKAT